MKNILLLPILLIVAACSPSGKAPQPGRLVIFAGIPPIAGVAEAIARGNDQVDVVTLVGDGQSPHSFEPTAKQLARLGEARMLITIGLSFEQALADKIQSLYPGLTIVAADERIEKRPMPHEHGPECDHDHGTHDPHVWLDLPNLKTISQTVLEAMVAMDPTNKGLYEKNFETHAQRLTLNAERLEKKLAPHAASRFYVYHPSFGYFADRHQLAQVAIELDGKSPSPRQLADLIEQAQIDRVKVIFVQKRFPSDSAQAVAKAIDGEVLRVDPLNKDVVATLGRIADSIARAMEP